MNLEGNHPERQICLEFSQATERKGDLEHDSVSVSAGPQTDLRGSQVFPDRI